MNDSATPTWHRRACVVPRFAVALFAAGNLAAAPPVHAQGDPGLPPANRSAVLRDIATLDSLATELAAFEQEADSLLGIVSDRERADGRTPESVSAIWQISDIHGAARHGALLAQSASRALTVWLENGGVRGQEGITAFVVWAGGELDDEEEVAWAHADMALTEDNGAFAERVAHVLGSLNLALELAIVRLA